MSMEAEIRAAHRRLAWHVFDRRRAQKLSREAAAERAEIAARHWARIEEGQGSPTLSTIAKIAFALGVTIADLLAPIGR